MWAIGGASFLCQLVVGSLTRAPSWDEAIYLSQVTRGAHALPFVASRARGITLLEAPLTSIGAPLWTVRLFLAAASALVLVVVFRVWVPVVGTGAVFGAGLFAASWPALFYGTEAMPNLWAALLAVGAVGCFLRSELRGADAGSRHAGAGLAVLVAAMALMRPPDAIVLGLALTVAALFLRSRLRSLLAVWLGVAAGVLPWIVEMSLRFGGPVGAVDRAAFRSHLGGQGVSLREHLAVTDGPLIGLRGSDAIPLVGGAWWIALLALAVVAVTGRKEPATVAARLAAFTGFALAGEYVFLIGGLAPRFLLPALALLSLAAGCGIASLSSRAWLRSRLVVAVGALVLAAWCAWQVGTFDRLEASASAERARPQAVGEAIGDHVGSSGCLVASTHDFAQVAYAARCAGRELEDLSAGSLERLRAASGERRIIVVSRDPSVEGLGTAVPSPVQGWVAFEL